MALIPASVSAPQGMMMMMASVRNLFLLTQSEGSKIDLKYGGSADKALVLLPLHPPTTHTHLCNHT